MLQYVYVFRYMRSQKHSCVLFVVACTEMSLSAVEIDVSLFQQARLREGILGRSRGATAPAVSFPAVHLAPASGGKPNGECTTAKALVGGFRTF